MCGIFGIISSPIDRARLSCDPAGLPGPEASLPDLKRALATLDFYRLHQAYSQDDVLAHWRSVAGGLAAADGSPGEASDLTEEMRRDVVWRIEHDMLDLLEAIAALLEDGERRDRAEAVWLAWQVELTLRALGRLEVRGRDSAGLAIMLWYDDDGAVRELLAADAEAHPQISRHAVAGTSCLVLTYRVAEEVGALGYNESTLRRLIREDGVFQRAVRARPREATVLAHTRWASNGIISLGNAHPVDGRLEAAGGNGDAVPPGRTLGVLNGDVDNFLKLVPSLEGHGAIPAEVTTDAKIIPALLEVASLDPSGDGLDAAVSSMTESLAGSLAIAVARADRPGTLWCGLKGTGQALYVADAGEAVVVASEVYGSAELTDRYWPLELAQERRADGRDAVVVRLTVRRGDRVCLRRLSGDSPICLEP